MATGESVNVLVGEVRLNACAGIGGGMYLAHLFAGGLLLIRLAGGKDHAKAQRKYQKKAQDALFHFHHTYPFTHFECSSALLYQKASDLSTLFLYFASSFSDFFQILGHRQKIP